MKRRLLQTLFAVLLVLFCAACSDSGGGGGGGGSDESSGGASPAPTAESGSLGGDEAPGAPEPPAVPDETASGTGALVVGGTASTFDVTACSLEPDPTAPEGALTMVALSGSGTTARGDAFTVEAQRFATGADPVTYTDTVTYTDSARILQAQRIEVAGQVTDLRDPAASSPLLRTRPDGMSLQALASGPGEDAQAGGLIGLALTATC